MSMVHSEQKNSDSAVFKDVVITSCGSIVCVEGTKEKTTAQFPNSPSLKCAGLE